MIKTKATKIGKNGNRLNYGQLLLAGGAPMQKLKVGTLPAMPARQSVDTALPRDGAAKRTGIAHPIAGARIAGDMELDPTGKGGARLQDQRELSAYHMGVAVQDEPNTLKLSQTGQTVPVNPGTAFSKSRSLRGTDKGPTHGSDILSRSVRDLSHHADIDKAARLPASIVAKRG